MEASRRRSTENVDNPDDEIVQLYAGIITAMENLPEPWRECLWHVEVLGYSEARVAHLMGIATQSVQSILKDARQELRQAHADLR